MTYQWHIFMASLDPVTGSEQAGTRPVLVISREALNQLLPVVNVVPLTSRKSPARRIYPNEVLIRAGTPVFQWTQLCSVTRSARWTSGDCVRIWVK
ncbi:MAG: type II toxin-antitoxin system PemK/MazF family toxin [Caldilineaceae bacterium]